jgi:thioester reductase-like protein
VYAVRDMLELSVSTFPCKCMLHVSTVSVFSNSRREPGVPRQESADLAEGATQPGLVHSDAYSQGKWVAEMLVARAFERGVPVCVARLGFISWPRGGAADAAGGEVVSSLSGVRFRTLANRDDWVTKLVLTALRTGFVPMVRDAALEMLPVDTTASALLSICRAAFDMASGTLSDRALAIGGGALPQFNVCNAHGGGRVKARTMFRWLQDDWQRLGGARLVELPMPAWLKLVESCEGVEDFLPLLGHFKQGMRDAELFSDANTRALLGVSWQPPLVDREYVSHLLLRPDRIT